MVCPEAVVDAMLALTYLRITSPHWQGRRRVGASKQSLSAQTHTHTQSHTHTHTHTHTVAHTHTGTLAVERTHASKHTHTHARAHVRTYTHTHTHTHTHTIYAQTSIHDFMYDNGRDQPRESYMAMDNWVTQCPMSTQRERQQSEQHVCRYVCLFVLFCFLRCCLFCFMWGGGGGWVCVCVCGWVGGFFVCFVFCFFCCCSFVIFSLFNIPAKRKVTVVFQSPSTVSKSGCPTLEACLTIRTRRRSQQPLLLQFSMLSPSLFHPPHPPPPPR